MIRRFGSVEWLRVLDEADRGRPLVDRCVLDSGVQFTSLDLGKGGIQFPRSVQCTYLNAVGKRELE